MDASLLSLTAYKNGLAPSDPDLPSATAHVQYRHDLDDYGKSCTNLAKAGPGSNPIGNPPPPPGI